MKRHELRELIAGGESSTVEFKRKFTTGDKIAREMIAFANTAGGYLLLGVDDDGRIVGVDSEKHELELLAMAAALIEPPIAYTTEIVELDWRDILVVHVANSSYKPHKLRGESLDERPHDRKTYIRQGENSVAAGREMVRFLAAQRSDAPPMTLSIGDRERRLFTYLERHGRVSVPDFAKLVNISRRRASQILVKLVRAGILHIHTDGGHDHFTLV